MQQEYQRQKNVVTSINTQLKRQPNFAIFSRLEELAGQTGIRGKIIHMKPTVSTPSEVYNEESVEVKMEGVTLEQLVHYLHQVENSPQLLKIKRLEIKPRFDNRQILTATFRVSAFTLKEGSRLSSLCSSAEISTLFAEQVSAATTAASRAPNWRRICGAQHSASSV